jgi:hypothetical protein
VEKTLWELALGRFARVVLTEMKGKRVVSTFPISLHISTVLIKTKTRCKTGEKLGENKVCKVSRHNHTLKPDLN